MSYRSISILFALALACGASGTVAADDRAAGLLKEVGDKYNVNLKVLFATNCSWCHDGYGLEAGKAPKLAGSAKSADEIAKQIENGKSGYMPGFKKTLKPEQIQALAEYIKALPND